MDDEELFDEKFEAAVIDVITKSLSIETEWTGWDYGARNELELRIKLGDNVVATSRVSIHIVEESNDW